MIKNKNIFYSDKYGYDQEYYSITNNLKLNKMKSSKLKVSLTGIKDIFDLFKNGINILFFYIAITDWKEYTRTYITFTINIKM